ncbi:MAG: hypothetical protein HY046_12175 [Acidobacteria bacterium]|nr:hypothetical protein [Acidobacteriota bacterium]
MSDPLRGRIVPGLGGIRKARKGNPLRGKGKSGGFRYFYFYLEHRGRIHLMRLIDKNEQEDLSSQERDVIQRQVAALKTL